MAKGLGRPKQYHGKRIPTMINIDSNAKEELEEIAAGESKSFSQKINELIMQELERKKSIGGDNPIRVSYNASEDNKSLQIPLAYYLKDIQHTKAFLESANANVLHNDKIKSVVYANAQRIIQTLKSKIEKNLSYDDISNIRSTPSVLMIFNNVSRIIKEIISVKLYYFRYCVDRTRYIHIFCKT